MNAQTDIIDRSDLDVTLRMLNDLIYKIQKDARRQGHPSARKLLEMAWQSDAIVEALP